MENKTIHTMIFLSLNIMASVIIIKKFM